MRRQGAIAWIFLAGLVGLCGLLGVLQYRWLGEISTAEQTRMRTTLEAAAGRFGLDFDREITRLLMTFAGWSAASPAATTPLLAERLASWRADAPWPGLLADVVIWERDTAGTLGFWRLDEATAALVPLDWPDGRQLAPDLVALTVPPGRRSRSPQLLDGRLGVLQLPLVQRLAPSFSPTGSNTVPGSPRAEHGYLARLDLELLRTEVLPSLGRRHLVTDGEPYPFAVRSDDGSEICRFGTVGPDAAGDVASHLFGLLPPEEMHGFLGANPLPGPALGPTPGPTVGARGSREHSEGHGPGPRGLFALYEGAAAPVWTLVVWHPRGSLGAALDELRWRNLSVGFGVLLLLAAAGVMLVVAARRAEAVARQQLQLVAGITHELRTPLAGIRSLGQNLADGIVTRSDQVRRYGERIESEGRRLTQLVEQALALSGLLARGRRPVLRPLAASELLATAAADGAALAAEVGGTIVEAEASPDLWLAGDAEALRRALGNLVQNALRHAGGEITLSAVGSGPGSSHPTEVHFTVADRGPGIDPAERLRLFEPFFRGQRAIDAQIAGSGLGLTLVREIAAAHGGRVDVADRPGGGAVVSVAIPAITRPLPATGETGNGQPGPVASATEAGTTDSVRTNSRPSPADPSGPAGAGSTTS